MTVWIIVNSLGWGLAAYWWARARYYQRAWGEASVELAKFDNPYPIEGGYTVPDWRRGS